MSDEIEQTSSESVNTAQESADTAVPAEDIPVQQETVAEAAAAEEAEPAPQEKAKDEPRPDVNITNPHVTLDTDIHVSVDKTKSPGWKGASLITRPLSEFEKTNSAAAQALDDLKSSPGGREWLYHFTEGAGHYMAGGRFTGAFEREDSDWGQYVEYDGVRIRAGAPTIGGTGQRLSGAKAAAAMRAGMGMAKSITAPLWHSGFWINITAPLDSELLILMHQIMDEKIALGNATVGIAFSSNGVFTARKLAEFILSRVYNSSMVAMEAEDMLRMIKITDYQVLLHTLALSIYPHGFVYRRPCINDISRCEAVTEHHLNLAHTLLVDRSSMSVEQRRFLAEKKKVRSIEDVQKYQEMGRSGMTRTVDLNENLSVTFRVPSLYDWFESGGRWVNHIEDVVERAFGNELTVKQKNIYLQEQSLLTFLRQFSHWIVSIKDREFEYDDPETIDAMIGVLSEDDTSIEAFMNGLDKFIDDATFAAPVIAAHDCPVCGKPQSVAENRHPGVIPIDLQQVVFTLAGQRTQRAITNTTNN